MKFLLEQYYTWWWTADFNCGEKTKGLSTLYVWSWFGFLIILRCIVKYEWFTLTHLFVMILLILQLNCMKELLFSLPKPHNKRVTKHITRGICTNFMYVTCPVFVVFMWYKFICMLKGLSTQWMDICKWTSHSVPWTRVWRWEIWKKITCFTVIFKR